MSKTHILNESNQTSKRENVPTDWHAVSLRVQVIRCRGLPAKDLDGTSDPYVVLNFGDDKRKTPVARSTLDPEYRGEGATFDFHLPLSHAGCLGDLECLIWDKDPVWKPDDYIGKAVIPLEEWLKQSSAVTFDDPQNEPFEKAITYKRGTLAGSIELKIGCLPVEGIVMLEVESARDLPKWKNMLRTGLDMDPVCEVSFGGRSSTTRRIQKSLEPVWNHKLLLRVHKSPTNPDVNFTVFDHDKVTKHDQVGSTSLPLSRLTDKGVMIYHDLAIPEDERDIELFELPLESREPDCKPVLTVRAKYLPYDAIRQVFWRKLLDLHGKDIISRSVFKNMFESLGSTPSPEAIDGFFNGSEKEDVTFDDVIAGLEAALHKPKEQCEHGGEPDSGLSIREVVEHVLRIEICPLCQKSTGERDVVTHSAQILNYPMRHQHPPRVPSPGAAVIFLTNEAFTNPGGTSGSTSIFATTAKAGEVHAMIDESCVGDEQWQERKHAVGRDVERRSVKRLV
ncbi:hypothetical protein FRC00_005337 [Tulasnella sp. 408]|nr:hypothetical protein FRC00_005337 [Tulasnella sp. 408]